LNLILVRMCGAHAPPFLVQSNVVSVVYFCWWWLAGWIFWHWFTHVRNRRPYLVLCLAQFPVPLQLLPDYYCVSSHLGLCCAICIHSVYTQEATRGSVTARIFLHSKKGIMSVDTRSILQSTVETICRLWGLPSLLSNGYRGLFTLRVKRPGREADHSPPSSAGINNGGTIPPLPHTSSWHGA
jgi:hypothetical protein